MCATIAPNRTLTREPAVAGKPVVDPAGWTRQELEHSTEWIRELSAAEVAEIEAAVAAIEARGLDIKDITRANFPLPTVGAVMAEVRGELLDGRGFVLMRGLPVGRMSRAQLGAAFFGLGTYLGDAVSQNAEGHVLGHVKDLGKDYADPMVRGYQTSAMMTFHSDQCDYVCLLCLHPAKSGGASVLTSSVTLYNEMLKRRPDLAAELCRVFHWTRHGEVPPGKDPWYKLAVFSFEDGYLSVRGAGTHLLKAETLPGAPKLTEKTKEAVALFQQLAHELAMPMDFRPGDIQFVHNHVTLHTRTAFEDWPEPERKRHLMRLWLNDRQGRPIPRDFRESISGIEVEGTVRTAPLDMV